MNCDADWTFGDRFEIRVNDQAIAVYRRGTDALVWQIEWSDIEEIIVWKEDLGTVDSVCMGFAWCGSDILKQVDEEMRGWHELRTAIVQRLGVKETDWWNSVAFPAFLRNQQTIWKRP